MNSRTAHQKRRRFTAFLLLPLLLVLTGCFKLDMNVDIRAEDDATLTMDLFDKTGVLDMEDLGCEEFQDDLGNGTSESIEDSEGNQGCRITGEVEPSKSSDDFSITKEGDELVFKMGRLDEEFGGEDGLDLDDPTMQQFAPEVNIQVTFPGAVTYASEGGEISGNTVTWTGIEVLATALEARGATSGGAAGGGDTGDESATDDEQPEATATDDGGEDEQGGVASDDQATTGDEGAHGDTRDADSSSFPLWVVIVLGILLLLVVFLIVMLARRKPAADQSAGNYPPQQQYPGQHPGDFHQQGQYSGQGQYPGQYPGYFPEQGQHPQQGQYPPQAQYPGQQWDQTQPMPPQGQQQWDQTQQWGQGPWDQGNSGGQPPQQ